jgi:uncharacterized membrane protein YhfC
VIDILSIAHLLNGLLMVAMPVGLGIYLAARIGGGWRIWWIGAGTFILSQIGHIPFNALIGQLFRTGVFPTPPQSWQLPFNAVFLGLSAGIWEECARYAAYRWWAKDARAWRSGLQLGAGHGGIEAIILGGLVLWSFVNMLYLRNADISKYVPAEQLALAQKQVAAYWSAQWYQALLGAVERLFSIIFHLTASLLVLQAFTRKQVRWLFIAIGWHALVDGIAVYGQSSWGVYIVEGLLGLNALISLAVIWWLKGSETLTPPEPDIPPPLEESPVKLTPVAETPENLDESRFV